MSHATTAVRSPSASVTLPRFDWLLCLGLTLCSSPARADGSTLASLDLARCPKLDRARFERLLNIELDTLQRQHLARPIALAIRCDPTRITLHVSDGQARQTRTNTLARRDSDPEAETRLLVLSASELIAELWEQPHQGEVTPDQTAPSTALDTGSTTPPMQRSGRWTLALGFEAASISEPRAPLYGATLAGEYALSNAFSLTSGLALLRGVAHAESVDVKTTSLALRVGGYVGFDLKAAHLAVGPSFELGRVWLRPRSSVPGAIVHDLAGIWSGAALHARAHVPLSDRWFLALNAHSGVVLKPVVGLSEDARPELSIDGAWFGGGVGAGAAF